MRYELLDFQKDAVNDLLKKMSSMQRNYETDGELSAVSLTAPTGAGKTVISAAVAEGLFFGNDVFPGDDRAVILWLSDSPSLNEQTMKRFEAATDLLNSATKMETIGPEFAKNHRKLSRGKIYFLNRQLLGKGKRLSNEAEGGRSFFDVLNDTIEDKETHLFLFLDEAHRGLGTGNDKGTSDSANKTIYSVIIDGQDNINKPMPCVIGISATPERFDNAMKGRKNRDIKASIDVPVSAVRKSGLIKDTIELRTPKKTADTKHQDLTLACHRLLRTTQNWKDYCANNNVFPVVIPLMVVQVEDKVSSETLTTLCKQIHKTLPWLDESDCFANVFGEHEEITTSFCKIPYIAPNKVSESTNIRVLFAKDAVSTGWDCPRAEVIYSRRKRTDPTYIAQLIGRMIRTPLARRIETVEELNTVSCYLPEFDADTVGYVIERLKEDNVPVEANKILRNPADVAFFGNTKAKLEEKLEMKKLASSKKRTSDMFSTSDNTSFDNNLHSDRDHIVSLPTEQTNNMPESIEIKDQSLSNPPDEFLVNAEEYAVNDNDIIVETEQELNDALERLPQVDPKEIISCFESIITRQVRHDKPRYFLNLWDCVDVILTDIEEDSDLEINLQEDFFNNIEAEIVRHQAEFKRELREIQNTTVTVRRVDPLTGETFDDGEEIVENDIIRLGSYYKRAVSVFAGASDMVKFYTKRRIDDYSDSDIQAVGRIAAVANCFEITQALEHWAGEKIDYYLSEYGSLRYKVSEMNRSKWDRIEGDTKPFIERELSIQASVTRQNMDYKKYPKHIVTDEYGWAYLNLNDLENKIVERELRRHVTVAWYRNQSRNLNASLSIPYELNGKWENMYPDFIFFVKTVNGIGRSIVDPHGDWLGDSIAKLKGYVKYIEDHPDMFSSVMVVADENGGECRYLDLMLDNVRTAIKNFTGSSAKELFTGPLSKKYYFD